MRCEECENGERHPARRARLAERDGRTALVLGVPVEICPSCGRVWLTMEVAKRLVLQGQMYGRPSLTCVDASSTSPATRRFPSM